MKATRIRKVLFILGCTLSLGVYAGVKTGEQAPDFTLTSVHGESVTLSDYRGKTVVLEWTNYDCPFVKKHYNSGNMQALQKEAADQGIIWLSICSSAPGKQGHFSEEVWTQRIQQSKAAPVAVLLDPSGETGRDYGAKTTPHMFVINAEGKLVYQGAIDSIASARPDDVDKAENYVRNALSALKQGQAAEPSTTRPYGCSVKY